MAKRLTVEQQIADLVALRDGPVTDETVQRLQAALAAKQNLVAAKAADIIRDRSLKQLQPDLEAAFARLMADPIRNDKGCVGKTSIARALQTLELASEQVYLAGITYVQKEPVWGGENDTAVDLRGLCAFGLVQMGYPRVMPHLVDLLADPAPEARLAAIQALAATGQEAASLLLRLKIHTGDTQPVLAECLTALTRLSPREAVPFVARFLTHADTAIADAAAIALGEARSPEALQALQAHYRSGLPRGARRVVLQAIALLRLPEAIESLVQIARDDDVPSALHAIEALSLYRRDDAVAAQLNAIARSRGEPALVDAMQEWRAGA